MIAELLKQSKLFLELPIEDIREYVVPRGRVIDYPKDSYLFSADDTVDHIQILLQGKVNTLYYYADGSYTLATTEFPPRVLALDLIATRKRISPYYALAAEAAKVFSLPADVILKPGEIPEPLRQRLLLQLITMLSHFHMQKEKHLVVLSRNGLRDRIMIYLSLQAQQKKSLSFSIPFSREEMAAYLCVNRSALSHELSLMKKEGIIDFSKNRFTILKYKEIGEKIGI